MTMAVTKEEKGVNKRLVENNGYLAAHREELRSRYMNEFVAAYNGQVVDHGTDLEALQKRLQGKYPAHELRTIAVQHIAEKDLPVIIFPEKERKS